MIRYTERDAELNLRPPFEMRGVEAVVTAKTVDWGALQDWVDETLNWRPAGVRCERRFAAGPVAFVVFLKVAAMRSRDPEHVGWGAMEESEMHVTVPVFELHAGLVPNPFDPVFYPLLLCLDSSPAMIAGREVFGFPKIGGEIEIVDGRCTARAEVWCGEREPRTVRGELLIGLERSGEATPAGAVGTPAEALGELTAGGLGRGEVGAERWEKLRDVWSGAALDEVLEWLPRWLGRVRTRQEFVFLKQCRDHRVAARASYRAVISTDVEFFGLRGLSRETGEWRLEVPEHRSSSLLRDIGLETGPVEAPLRVNFDFMLPPGRTVWSSNEGDE